MAWVWFAVSTVSAGPAEVAGSKSGMTTAALFVGSCTLEAVMVTEAGAGYGVV
jgi:hypothetical protein